jgi:hypothetical protein
MLPIRKVVLYKHGVGYFEREGEIVDDAVVDLQFRASEMNDVLKSLTTLDLGEGHIASISYESTKPVEKQLEDIAIRLSDQNSYTGLLAQVKGARVRIEVGPRRVEGVVTGIEQVSRQIGDAVVATTFVALLVDGESIQSFDLLEVKSLTFLDENLKKDLQHLLGVLIAAKKKDLKKLTIFGKGKGKRPLVASYTIETPVWKTSYRVLLTEKQSTIQGWALVDNTQEEDWDDVALTLVAGLPISFVHDLYSPRYKRRPVVLVQEEEAYAPPVLEQAEESMAEMDREESGAGRGMAVPASMAAPAPMKKRDQAADRDQARQRSVQVQTRTVEVGDLFQYEIRNPVTVKRNQSALVPILQGGFEGKRVAVYNPEVREKNPMSAVLFKNTTGMTLEGGPLTVLEDESYVGESMLDTMKPDEERLVPYSVELGCVISVDHRSERKDVHHALISNGTLHLYRYRIERKVYVIHNKSGRKLDLFLEHRFNHGWELVETEKPVEKTENFYRFRMEVPAKKTLKFIVSEKGDESESHSVQSVGRDLLKAWLESRFIDKKTLELLQSLADLNEKAATLNRRLQEREREINEIFQNQERLRKNLQSLGSSQDEKGLRERYVSEMAKEEDKLREFRAEIKQMREEKAKLEEDLRQRVGKVRYEATL